MKGIVFTELLQLVDATLGMNACERLIDAAQLPSGGAYTSVGTYPHAEMVALLTQLSAVTATPVEGLLRDFGEHLFGRFAVLFPHFLAGVGTTLEFAERVDGVIHREVRKLYPDAELPKFDHERLSASRLILTYRSARPLADLAEGLLLGCARHFGETLLIERCTLESGPLFAVRFDLTCPIRAPQPTS